MERDLIYILINRERDRQDAKWGPQRDNTLPEWATILGEEYGEACQEVLRVHFGEKSKSELIAELVQVAAVAVVWLEQLDYE